MKRSFWIIWTGPEFNDIYFYKGKAERDLRQKRRHTEKMK